MTTQDFQGVPGSTEGDGGCTPTSATVPGTERDESGGAVLGPSGVSSSIDDRYDPAIGPLWFEGLELFNTIDAATREGRR